MQNPQNSQLQLFQKNKLFYTNKQFGSIQLEEEYKAFFRAENLVTFFSGLAGQDQTLLAAASNIAPGFVPKLIEGFKEGRYPDQVDFQNQTVAQILSFITFFGESSQIWKPVFFVDGKTEDGENERVSSAKALTTFVRTICRILRDYNEKADVTQNKKGGEQQVPRASDDKMEEEDKTEDKKAAKGQPGQPRSQAEDLQPFLKSLDECLKNINSIPIILTIQQVEIAFKCAYGEVMTESGGTSPYLTTFKELQENHLVIIDNAVATTPHNMKFYIAKLTIPGESGSQDYGGFFKLLSNNLKKAISVRKKYNHVIKDAINRMVNADPTNGQQIIMDHQRQLARICETELDDYSDHISYVEIYKDVVDKFFSTEVIRQFYGQSPVTSNVELTKMYQNQICMVTSLLQHFTPLITYQSQKLIPSNFQYSNLIKQQCDQAKEQKVVNNLKKRFLNNPAKLMVIQEIENLNKRKSQSQKQYVQDQSELARSKKKLKQNSGVDVNKTKFTQIADKFGIIESNFGKVNNQVQPSNL